MNFDALIRRFFPRPRTPSGSPGAPGSAPAGPHGTVPAQDHDRALFGEAHAHYQQGRLEEAEAACRTLLDKYPDDFDLLRMVGMILGRRGQFEAAVTFIERARALNAADASIHGVMGNCLRGLQRHREALACYDKALALQPDDAETWFNRGATHRDLGSVDQALADFGRVAALRPDHIQAHEIRASLLMQRQHYAAAADSYRQVLRLAPGSVDTRFKLGNALTALLRHEEALACYEEILAGDHANVSALAERARALYAMKRHVDALASLDEALRIAPDHPLLLVNRGAFLREAGRYEDALATLDKALAREPQLAVAHYNRGAVLETLTRYDAALESFDRALALDPEQVDCLAARATTLRALRRSAEALAPLDRALALQPGQHQLHALRALVLGELRRPEEALTSMDQALALKADDAELHFERARLLTDLVRPKEAIIAYDRVLALDPDHKQALFNRGYLLIYERQGDAAAADWERLARIAPDYPYLDGYLLRARMYNCDWHDVSSQLSRVRAAVGRGEASIDPFVAAGMLSEPQILRRCAEIYVGNSLPAATSWPTAVKKPDRRIRVGYMAGEFRSHATTYLTAELFERHDRKRFEVFAFDNGFDDGSPARRRLECAFDEMVPVAELDDAQTAAAINRRGIDILIDLNGHTGMRKTGALRLRPAPIQVNWLGFPGTMGAAFMDYIVVDPVIVPPGHEIHYSEKVVRLPDTYQSNDRARAVAAHTPTRAGASLPPEGFVFCCFNDNYKITSEIFDIWMRLLKQVPDSVLWLLEISPPATRNLRKEATIRGVAAERLIFAPRMAMPEHLARHRLADLFVDTLPYNAHTTASDALWAGLPLVTCTGSAFAGRVATSLLHAAGLPELATPDSAAYEALALELATTPLVLAALRSKLAANRATCALFDAQRFTRHLESAYVTMVERALRGEPPASFDVAPLSA